MSEMPEKIWVVTGRNTTGGYWSRSNINLKEYGQLGGFIRSDIHQAALQRANEVIHCSLIALQALSGICKIMKLPNGVMLCENVLADIAAYKAAGR